MIKTGIIKPIIIALTILFAFMAFTPESQALDVHRQVLDNGMTLMVVERRNLPVVRVSMGIDAGNIHEAVEKAGLANLTASLLTEGTASRTAVEISEEIEFVGGSAGASGGDDYITAGLSVLKKDVDLGFDIFSDIIINPVFPEKELMKKIERVKAGLRSQEENPGFLSSREFGRSVFGSHPYGRLVSGSVESLDNISRDDLVDFHKKFYVPNNAVMAVVGDITLAEVESLIGKYFKGWNRRNVPGIELPVLSSEKARKTVILGRNLTQANILLGHIGVSRDNPDYYALSVMNYILGGGGFASRLMHNIREEKGLAYDIRSSISANKLGGSFQVRVQTKNESANTAIEEILKEIERMRTSPVTDAELDDAKSFMTGSFPMRIETGSRIARFLVAVEHYGLGVDYIDNYSTFINNITKSDILRVANKYLDPNKYILVIVADEEKVSLSEKYRQP